ncbi:MAG TPA: sigma 54-interacting transcriptional regulator [Haliangiales bacterium]|nr:sigma 54-interacting transcriptional regulator [Haliangiales bacterium]
MAALALQKIKLTAVRGKERGREWVLWADVVTAGKAPGNDIVLDEETVSREHFEIVRDGKGWLVRDLRSTNGTFLDGAQIQSGYLRVGSVVSAGAAQLKFTPLAERVELAPLARFGPLEAAGAARDALAALDAAAAVNVAVMLEGEPGTGKELAARTLHERSRKGPFVAVDCRRPPAAVEQDLHGPRPALERAHGGTLFLVEPAELGAEAQGKLLRVLAEREPRRGGRRLDARVVSASSRPLAAEVERGRFRDELAQRLSGVTVRLPPLRERRDDVPALAQAFAAAAGRALAAAEVAWLAAHDWPGNLDELRDVVARAFPQAGAAADPGFDAGLPFRAQKERWSDEFERRYVTWLLHRAGGNISQAARDGDMDRKYLHKLLKKHGVA